MIVIEFDSFVNDEWDPKFEHVGISKNSIHSANYTAWNVSLHSGDSTDACVSYNPTTQMLNLRWSYGAGNDSTDMNTTLSYRVDLREVLPEWVIVWFSAATDTYVEKHILLSWEFNSSLSMEQKDEDDSKGWKVAVGITVPLGVLVLVTMVICRVYWRKQREVEEKSGETIATGRKAMDSVDPDSDLGLVQWVWGLLGKGELILGVDQRLNKAFPSLPMKMPVPMYRAEPDASEVSSGSGSGAASITYTSVDLIR
ncbi:hypothetical protein L1987_36799 [Smallanthus sonchifolius]|uniref:Uncharacterized protein n=1 Tax=Smallanthus sonchifolius TaxID=185202 RepID=A0ACB9HFX6_9ASTR|nr:hypothetical protein L1987_36799 [Smallanthus sonchifolius]